MTMNFHGAVTFYTKMNCSVIPLETGKKTPIKGFLWKENSLKPDRLENYSSVNNTGITLGERSNGLVDLDFDTHEAGIIAQKLFPDCPGFGRKSSTFGHKVLYCPDAGKTKQFKLSEQQAKAIGVTDNEKSVIMEVRANGSYTMFPPSIHPSGERVEWLKGFPTDFPSMPFKEVLVDAGLCSFLAIILKCYPTQPGIRDDVCLALSGALLRYELSPEQVDDWIIFIAEQKGDEEAQNRKKALATKEKMDAGEEVTGLPRLCELLGIEKLKDVLSKWLYGSSTPPKDSADKEVLKLNEKYFVIRNEGGKCLVGSFEPQPIGKDVYRDMLSFQAKGDFQSWFSNQQVVVDITDNGAPITKPLGKLWWEHPKRRQYDRVVFAPGQEAPKGLLNLWRDYGVEARKGSWRKLRKHIWRILAKRDKEAFRYIIMWCAWAVQNPDSHAEVALVFRGGKGTGKGTFCNAMVKLFGHHGLAISSTHHLTGRFNGHMRDCVLLFADEAIVPGDKKGESILKAIITEPKLLIEGKNKDPIQCLNYLHIMMASNDEWVVPASADERRYAVFDISNEMAQNDDWFGSIYRELDEDGSLEALLYFLKNLKLKGWHPRKHIPVNAALRDQQVQSLRSLDKVWFDWISSGEAIGEAKSDNEVVIPTKELSKIANTSDRATGDYMRLMGCSQTRLKTGRAWKTPSLAEARTIWDKLKFPFEWDETDQWYPTPPDEPPF